MGIDGADVKFSEQCQELLVLPEERELLLRISELPEVVTDAAKVLEPHRLIYFCQDLIKIFHSYFTKYRNSEKIIAKDDVLKTKARLALTFAVKQAIFNALNILGISAPEYMEQS
jgi:arginyl-tRNA synthetase